MKVHLFGATSSPGCANYGLKRLANDFKNVYGSNVCDFVHSNFYVDDRLCLLSTEEEAIDLIAKTQALCREGSLNLHNFVSNSK